MFKIKKFHFNKEHAFPIWEGHCMSRVGILGKNMAITLGEDMVLVHRVRTEYILYAW